MRKIFANEKSKNVKENQRLLFLYERTKNKEKFIESFKC